MLSSLSISLQMSRLFFPNNYPDYQGEQYSQVLNSRIIQWIEHYVHKLDQNIPNTDPSDGSVYTGYAGIALLYTHLATVFPDQQNHYLSKAKSLIDVAVEHLDGRITTFLCGMGGPYAIAAVIYYRLGDQKTANKYIEKIISLKKLALTSPTPDEYLYGRAGYIYTLMYLRRELGESEVYIQLISEVFEAMIRSGEKYARQKGSSSPLMYDWFGEEYLGAAHGLAGIVYLLFKVTHHDAFAHLRPYVNSHLIPTVEYLKSKRLPSGNYMSANDDHSDELVQWCHGAPGFVYLFLRAYEVTGNQSYLQRAIAAGDVVWQRGLLKKGYGICHGAAGNGYSFLYLYRITNDMKWLHRAMKFAEFCLDYGKHRLSRTPDCPFSLFEGLAGTIYYMADILKPAYSRFPAFE